MFRRGKGIVQAMARPVLLVDDDPDLVRLLEFALSGAKIPSASAGTGAEALARLEEVAPEAVVLDLGLPDMDGKEVLAELRQRQPELPVVVLTASSEVSDAVACMQLGASDYVNKPCDPTRLLTSVRNAITQAALRRRVEVRWRLERLDWPPLLRLQARLLDRALELVRPGGAVVYATCSVDPRENQAQVQAALERHAGLTLEHEQVHLPTRGGGDGGYAARLRKPG